MAATIGLACRVRSVTLAAIGGIWRLHLLLFLVLPFSSSIKRGLEFQEAECFLLIEPRVASEIGMASQELLLVWRKKWKDNPSSLDDPPSLPNKSSVSEEVLEGGFATAAVIAPVTSDVTMEVESHAPPPEHSEDDRSCCCSGSMGIICLYVGGDVLLPGGDVLIGYRYDGACRCRRN